MKRLLLASAALAVAACSDAGPLLQKRAAGGPARNHLADPDSIFTTQAPASTVEPGWDGMQVGTEFTLSDSVTVTGFRYYKASGEAGSHTARLYRSSGTQVASKSFSGGTSSGWQRVSVTPFPLAPGTYVVTVNTNLYQAKTGAYFDDDGPIYREGLEATGGRYGYPTGQFPSYSTSDAFFVDLVYVP